MKLKKIAVDSTHIMDDGPEDLFKSARAPSEVKDLTPYGLLIEAMSVCHTVKPIKQKGMMNESLKYYSSSPDEVALIESLDNDFDLQLIDNKNNLISLKSSYAIGLHKQYKIIYSFPFSSEAARMGSLVIDTDVNEAFFVVKGSDASISPLLQYIEDMKQVDYLSTQLAKEGLRTLVFAMRHITSVQQAETWVNARREGKMTEEYFRNLLETKLQFVGITAVEDKLQDQASETLSKLK